MGGNKSGKNEQRNKSRKIIIDFQSLKIKIKKGIKSRRRRRKKKTPQNLKRPTYRQRFITAIKSEIE